MLIDVHNSRYESAGKDELRGIYKESKYVKMYENAIKEGDARPGLDAEVRIGA